MKLEELTRDEVSGLFRGQPAKRRGIKLERLSSEERKITRTSARTVFEASEGGEAQERRVSLKSDRTVRANHVCRQLPMRPIPSVPIITRVCRAVKRPQKHYIPQESQTPRAGS